MKTYLLFLFLAFVSAAEACEGHLYRLALNQRSFYNPASLCPYCKGSTFIGGGISFVPRTDAYGYYTAVGDDGENILHGPWDFSCSRSFSSGNAVSAYSLRYAWRQEWNDWRLASGFRASVFDIRQSFSAGEGNAIMNAPPPVRTSVFDFDAGIMLTNMEGVYFGFSVQHLRAPSKTIENGNGDLVAIELPRSYALMGGMPVGISRRFDLLPEINAMISEGEGMIQPGILLRHRGSATAGAGLLIARNRLPQFDIRLGYTSSIFKWLGAVAFTPEGPVVETGLVYRFGVERWRITRISDPCTGGTCTAQPPVKKINPKKREFDPHQ